MKHAFRSLLRSPGFTAVAVLTLALGIGMNTSMFSLLNGFLLRPLSYPQADQLFRLDRVSRAQPTDLHSPANFDDIVHASSELAEFAAARGWAFTLTVPDRPADSPRSVRITANFFSVLGLRPALGRDLRADEEAPGANNVILISHRYWQSRFQGTPDIIGRTVRLDGQPVEIVGVMPEDPDMPRILDEISLFRPIGLTTAERSSRADNSLFVIGRYRDGVTPEQAAGQFETIAARLAADFPDVNSGATFRIRSLQSTTLSGTGLTVTLLLIGLSSAVLLIACANLANLLLARAISRGREFSIRGALGASRLQLIKTVAAECLLLATFGGLAALLVSAWTTGWLSSRFGSPDNPADLSPDVRVFAFAIGASLLTALIFGLAPAWWAARFDVADSLKSGSRSATGSPTQQRYRQVLIVAQFALALFLLAGAGYFLRGLDRLIGASMGWNPEPVIAGNVNLASSKYATAEPIIQFHAALRQKLLAEPGVENVAVSYQIPLFNPPARRNFLVAGREPPPPGEELVAFVNGVSSTFLDTVGLRLVQGRFIDATDHLTGPPVVVINQSMAHALFPDGNVLGQRLGQTGGSEIFWAEIVGVVEDARPLNITPSPVRFHIYKPFPQEAWQWATISVRATDAARAALLVEPIRRAVASLDPDQPLQNLMTVPERIDRNFSVWQTINSLLTLFAGLGLLLAALGIYSVTARLVAQRTAEIGIRMALGAQVRDILRLILGGGIRLALAGTGLGIVGAILLSDYFAKALPTFGSGSLAPVFVAGAILAAISLLACFFPARRASRVNPVEALRAD